MTWFSRLLIAFAVVFSAAYFGLKWLKPTHGTASDAHCLRRQTYRVQRRTSPQLPGAGLSDVSFTMERRALAESADETLFEYRTEGGARRVFATQKSSGQVVHFYREEGSRTRRALELTPIVSALDFDLHETRFAWLRPAWTPFGSTDFVYEQRPDGHVERKLPPERTLIAGSDQQLIDYEVLTDARGDGVIVRELYLFDAGPHRGARYRVETAIELDERETAAHSSCRLPRLSTALSAHGLSQLTPNARAHRTAVLEERRERAERLDVEEVLNGLDRASTRREHSRRKQQAIDLLTYAGEHAEDVAEHIDGRRRDGRDVADLYEVLATADTREAREVLDAELAHGDEDIQLRALAAYRHLEAPTIDDYKMMIAYTNADQPQAIREAALLTAGSMISRMRNGAIAQQFIKDLKTRWNSNKDFESRELVLLTLGNLGDESTLSFLQQVAENGNDALAAAALRAMRHFVNDATEKTLSDFVRDPSLVKRAAALDALYARSLQPETLELVRKAHLEHGGRGALSTAVRNAALRILLQPETRVEPEVAEYLRDRLSTSGLSEEDVRSIYNAVTAETLGS